MNFYVDAKKGMTNYKVTLRKNRNYYFFDFIEALNFARYWDSWPMESKHSKWYG